MDAKELIRKARHGTLAVVYVPDLSGQTFATPEDVVAVPSLGAHGTAVAIAPNRFITCSHVIKPLVSTPGRMYLVASLKPGPAEITYQVDKAFGDEGSDVALLSAVQQAGQVGPLALDDRDPEMGTEVLCLGVPFPEKTGSFGEGAANVKITLPVRAAKGIVASSIGKDGTFEVDVQLNPGMSGGPVFSLETGFVIGICQAFKYTRGTEGTFTASLSKVVACSLINLQLSGLERKLVETAPAVTSLPERPG